MFSDMNLILNMNLGDPWHVEIRGDKMVNVAFSSPTPPQSSYIKKIHLLDMKLQYCMNIQISFADHQMFIV